MVGLFGATVMALAALTVARSASATSVSALAGSEPQPTSPRHPVRRTSSRTSGCQVPALLSTSHPRGMSSSPGRASR